MVHVKRNIEDKALKLSNMKTIQLSFSKGCMKLFSSTIVDQYEEQLKYMRSKWKNNWGLMRYLTEYWLDPYKDRLVSVWTDHVTHFGTRTTNRVESAHATLKLQLGSSIKGFDNVFVEINNLLNDQLDEVRRSLELSCCTIPMVLDKIPILSQLQHMVSNECMNKLIRMHDEVIA
ncbi:unnamed protein product [Cuscuta europaea]|uniref:Protein FAR1-RELATED SEQUENCE n=1 Tax=Cuscuta europaea TaxID=41803 RepID=A0A9P1EK44_CUSEU|nr:unnamed protein product [Cuscuta europaea]